MAQEDKAVEGGGGGEARQAAPEEGADKAVQPVLQVPVGPSPFPEVDGGKSADTPDASEGSAAPLSSGDPVGSPSTAPTHGASSHAADLEHPVYSRMRALRFVRGRHSLTFFLYAFVGAAVMISVKEVTREYDLSIVIYFAVVMALMGSYFLLNMLNLEGLRLRYDQLGDNLYYLGFVYTLSTLTYTLYVFQTNISEIVVLPNIFEIISSFGVALSSTVVGVVLRIVAHMMRLDPTEVEDAVRQDLIDLTSRVRGSLDIVVRDMTIFGDQTRQAIAELHGDIARDVGSRVQELVDVSNQVLTTVDQSFQHFTENTKRLNQASSQTVRAMTALVSKIEQIEAPATLIEDKLAPATEQFERVVSSMREMTDRETERSEALHLVTQTMNEAIASVKDHLHMLSGAIQQEETSAKVHLAATALGEMAETVTQLRDHMTQLVGAETRAVTALRREYDETLTAVRHQNNQMRDELEKFRRLSADTQSALVDLARAMKAAL